MSSDAVESTRTIEWLAWFEVNKKKLLIVAIAIVALGAAAALYRVKSNADEAAGWTALFRVARPVDRVDTGGSPTPQAYLQVASAHSGTEAGAQARLLAGQAWFEEGKYTEARQQFEGFIRQFGDTGFASAAALGVAACLDSENKTNEALAAYQSVATQYPNSAVSSQAKLAKARLYESRNEPAQALKIYDELARPGTQSLWSSDAGMRREQLLLAHPELVVTNRPASASSPRPVTAATNAVRILSTDRSPAKP